MTDDDVARAVVAALRGRRALLDLLDAVREEAGERLNGGESSGSSSCGDRH